MLILELGAHGLRLEEHHHLSIQHDGEFAVGAANRQLARDLEVFRVTKNLREKVVQDRDHIGLVHIAALRERENRLEVLNTGNQPVLNTLGNRSLGVMGS